MYVCYGTLQGSVLQFPVLSSGCLPAPVSSTRDRRDFLLPVLKKAGLAVPAEPHGAFYIYADCGRNSREYCMQLLEREAVAATPGVDFGANGTDRFVRFAYTRAMGDLEEAARRITRFQESR